jgi:hypothetical protein
MMNSKIHKADLEELADFVTVSSGFYDQLGDYYDQEAQEWLKEKLKAVD